MDGRNPGRCYEPDEGLIVTRRRKQFHTLQMTSRKNVLRGGTGLRSWAKSSCFSCCDWEKFSVCSSVRHACAFHLDGLAYYHIYRMTIRSINRLTFLLFELLLLVFIQPMSMW